jgi:hypothetical protein
MEGSEDEEWEWNAERFECPQPATCGSPDVEHWRPFPEGENFIQEDDDENHSEYAEDDDEDHSEYADDDDENGSYTDNDDGYDRAISCAILTQYNFLSCSSTNDVEEARSRLCEPILNRQFGVCL